MAFRTLSIDGGGMRGLYTAMYLHTLEQAFSKKRGLNGLDLGKAFRLIVGTSTGAIIAAALAAGVAPTAMVRLYQEHGPKIFPHKLPNRINIDLIYQLFNRPKYLRQGDNALRHALTRTFGTLTIRQMWETRGIALAVPAINMSTYRSWVFKTPHDPKSDHRDDDTSLTDVCLASSAAPLFRSLAAIPHHDGTSCDIFADGGLWANNPVMVALIESLRMNRDDAIEIFCLGSCGKPEGAMIGRDQVHRGLLEWRFGGDAATVSIAAQEFAFDQMARMLASHLRRQVSIVRFPADKIPGAMLEYLDLDETRSEGLEALIRQAQHDAHMTNSLIQQGTTDGRLIESLFNDAPPAGARRNDSHD